MFRYKTPVDQAIDLRKENAELKMKLEQVCADIEYISMMSDIELENDETEGASDEQ